MKGKRLKSVGGTVLIMVLTVMLVLIIMLMATLTVVTTAGQRIYAKYEEQQAYYTARSALDVFTKMLNDSTYGDTVTVGATTVFETQGYNIQKSLYDIIAQSDPGATNPVKNKNPYSAVSGAMASQPYIEYTAVLPDLNGGTDQYGKLNDGLLTVKVEVLDRTLNCGSDGTPATGKRSKDAMKLKITATTSFEGVESSAAMTMLTKAPPANAATRAVTITGGNDLKVDNTTILGGLATEGKVEIINNGDYWGNIYLGGQISMQAGSRMVATDEQWIFIKDGAGISNDFPVQCKMSGTDESKRGNVIIGGDLDFADTINTGSGGAIKMVVLGNLLSGSTPGSGNGFYHTGDLYVMGDVLNAPKEFKVTGNMYVGGDCDLKGAQNGVNITGDLYVSGTFDARKDGDGNYLSNVIIGSSGTDGLNESASASQLPKMETEMKTGDDGVSRRVPKTDADGYMEIEWPSSPGVPVKVATYGAVFTQFYRYADPANEDTITASEYAFLSQDDLDNLRKTAANGGKAPDTEERIHEYIDANIGSAVTVSIAASDTISSPGLYVVYPGHCAGGTLTIDAGGTVELILKPGTYANNGKILVKNGTTLKVYGEPGRYDFNGNWEFITQGYVDGDPVDGKLYVGDFAPSGKSLMEMNINFYFEGQSEINFNNQSIFVGHFYAPRSKVSIKQGHSVGSSLVYNGVQYDRTSPTFSFIGSLLCNEYETQSGHGGIAFVQTTETSTPGLPCLEFKATQYTRR